MSPGTKRPDKRRRVAKWLGGMAVGLAVLFLLIVFVLPSPLARYAIEDQLEDLGINHQGVDTVEIDLWNSEVSAGPITFRSQDAKEGEIAEAGFRYSFDHLFDNQAFVRIFFINGVDLKVKRHQDGSISFNGIPLERFKAEDKGEEPDEVAEDDGSGIGAGVEQFEFIDSRLVFEDYTGGSLTLELERLLLSQFFTWNPQKPGTLELDGTVNGFAVQWRGTARPFAEPKTVTLNSQMHGITIDKLALFTGPTGLVRQDGIVESDVRYDYAVHSNGVIKGSMDGSYTVSQLQIETESGDSVAIESGTIDIKLTQTIESDSTMSLAGAIAVASSPITVGTGTGGTVELGEITFAIDDLHFTKLPEIREIGTILAAVKEEIKRTDKTPAVIDLLLSTVRDTVINALEHQVELDGKPSLAIKGGRLDLPGEGSGPGLALSFESLAANLGTVDTRTLDRGVSTTGSLEVVVNGLDAATPALGLASAETLVAAKGIELRKEGAETTLGFDLTTRLRDSKLKPSQASEGVIGVKLVEFGTTGIIMAGQDDGSGELSGPLSLTIEGIGGGLKAEDGELALEDGALRMALPAFRLDSDDHLSASLSGTMQAVRLRLAAAGEAPPTLQLGSGQVELKDMRFDSVAETDLAMTLTGAIAIASSAVSVGTGTGGTVELGEMTFALDDIGFKKLPETRDMDAMPTAAKAESERSGEPSTVVGLLVSSLRDIALNALEHQVELDGKPSLAIKGGRLDLPGEGSGPGLALSFESLAANLGTVDTRTLDRGVSTTGSLEVVVNGLDAATPALGLASAETLVAAKGIELRKEGAETTLGFDLTTRLRDSRLKPSLASEGDIGLKLMEFGTTGITVTGQDDGFGELSGPLSLTIDGVEGGLRAEGGELALEDGALRMALPAFRLDSDDHLSASLSGTMQAVRLRLAAAGEAPPTLQLGSGQVELKDMRFDSVAETDLAMTLTGAIAIASSAVSVGTGTGGTVELGEMTFALDDIGFKKLPETRDMDAMPTAAKAESERSGEPSTVVGLLVSSLRDIALNALEHQVELDGKPSLAIKGGRLDLPGEGSGPGLALSFESLAANLGTVDTRTLDRGVSTTGSLEVVVNGLDAATPALGLASAETLVAAKGIELRKEGAETTLGFDLTTRLRDSKLKPSQASEGVIGVKLVEFGTTGIIMAGQDDGSGELSGPLSLTIEGIGGGLKAEDGELALEDGALRMALPAFRLDSDDHLSASLSGTMQAERLRLAAAGETPLSLQLGSGQVELKDMRFDSVAETGIEGALAGQLSDLQVTLDGPDQGLLLTTGQIDARADRLSAAMAGPLSLKLLSSEVTLSSFEGTFPFAGTDTIKAEVARTVVDLPSLVVEGGAMKALAEIESSKIGVRISNQKPQSIDIDSLRIAGVSADLSQAVEIDSIVIDGLTMSLNEGITALGGEGTSEAEAEGEDEPAPLSTRLGKLTISSGSKILFTDSTIEPEMNMEIVVKSATIGPIDTGAPEKKTDIDLAVAIDGAARAKVKGWANPLLPIPDFELATNLEQMSLPQFSPYASSMIGMNVDSGSLTADALAAAKSGALQGNIKILVEDLNLEPLSDEDDKSFEDTFGVPVDFAVGVLKNDKGQIDLGFPVSGTVETPEIDYSEAISKAIAGAAAAILPTSWFGDDGLSFKIQPVIFAPGAADITVDGATSADEIGALLKSKPQLTIQLCGRAAAADLIDLRGGELPKASIEGDAGSACGGEQSCAQTPTSRQAHGTGGRKSAGLGGAAKDGRADVSGQQPRHRQGENLRLPQQLQHQGYEAAARRVPVVSTVKKRGNSAANCRPRSPGTRASNL